MSGVDKIGPKQAEISIGGLLLGGVGSGCGKKEKAKGPDKAEKSCKEKAKQFTKFDLGSGKHYVGVTLGSRVPTARGIKEFQYSTDTRVAAVSWFHPFDEEHPFPEKILNDIYCNGSIPILTLEADREGGRGIILSKIKTEEMDEYLRTFAQAAAAWGKPFILRPLHEMNGHWMPWGGMPEEYKEAFQHIWEIFQKEKAHNVYFAWSPDAGFLDNIEDYYPGHKYVDVIGFSGYNRALKSEKVKHPWRTAKEIFGSAIARFKSSGKPLAIFEFGSDDEGERDENDKKIHDKANSLRKSYEWMVKQGIALSVYFNVNKLEKEDVTEKEAGDVESEDFEEAKEFIFRFWALNSDKTKLAFKEATSGNNFVHSLNPETQQISKTEISGYLQELLDKWTFKNFKKENNDFLKTEGRNMDEYEIREKLYNQTSAIIKNLFKETDVILNPYEWVGSPRLERVTKKLLRLADNLTSLEKYTEAILAYSLVPKHESVKAFRRMAIIGMANAISYRDFEGDASRSIGLFNYARHLLDDHWGAYDLPGKVAPGWTYPGKGGSLWLEDELKIPSSVEGTVAKSSLLRFGDKQNQIWDALIKAKYIDKNGIIQPEFNGEREKFKLETPLSPKDENQIFDILQKALDAAFMPQMRVDYRIKRKRGKYIIKAKYKPPVPQTVAHPHWKYVDDMLMMALTQAGLGARYSYLYNWDQAYRMSTPRLQEALRIWHTVGKRPYKMLPIEPSVWLTFAQLWSRGKTKKVIDKLLNRGKKDIDKANLCDKIRGYNNFFEDRGSFEEFVLWFKGKSEWLKYPTYLVAGADLIEADLRSRSDKPEEKQKAIEICEKVLQNSTVIAQRARACYIMARAVLGYAEQTDKALELCERAMKMLEERQEINPTKLGIRILKAEIMVLEGKYNKAIPILNKIIKLLKEYPVDSYLKRQAESNLATAFEQAGYSEDLELYFFKRLKSLIRTVAATYRPNFYDRINKKVINATKIRDFRIIIKKEGLHQYFETKDEFLRIRTWSQKWDVWF